VPPHKISCLSLADPRPQIGKLGSVAREQFRDQPSVAAPRKRRRRCGHSRCQVHGGASINRHREDVAARRTEVAHEAGDECQRPAVTRHLGVGKLLARTPRFIHDAGAVPDSENAYSRAVHQ